MNDIVQRLRGGIPGDLDYMLELISEAAAEIERLRTENRRLHLRLMIAYSEAAGVYDDQKEAQRG